MPKQAASPETATAWGSRSLRWSLALTTFLFVSGLVILCADFGRGAQLTVLVHTVLGVVFLVPLGLYLVPHLARRWRDRFSHLVLLGWMSGVTMTTAVLSGVVLTVQAAFGTRIDYGWDLVHTIGGCAVFAILPAHLLTSVRRNRPGEWSYVAGLLFRVAGAGVLLAVASFAGGALVAEPARRAPLPEGYGFRYGENPFAPSLARTDWLARLDADRRLAEFLGEVAADPAADVSEFVAGAVRLHEAERECRRRGERHVDEWGGLAAGAARIARLREIERASGERRVALAAALRAEVEADLARNRAHFERTSGIDAAALAGSASCGTSGCHEQILQEWEPSAHRYASRSAFFQLIQGAMADANGAESTRYCAGCHDPIALFSGAKNIYDEDLSSPGADEGISCASCHSIVRTDVQGNANYTLAPPERYLAEDSFIGRFLIRAYPRHHKASYGRPLLETAEFCGACHKQFIDKDINRATRVQLQNQYDAWKGSHWFVADASNPQRADPNKALACRDCHMRLRDSADPAAKRGKHRHHAFIAANQWLPRLHNLPHADEHIRLTEEWLRGETVIPEIADRWPGGPPVPIRIEAPESVRPGDTVKLRVIVDNVKVGHTFPTGPLDVIQSWVEVKVRCGDSIVFHSGGLDADGFIDPAAFIFKAEGVDRAGNLIDRHNLWDMVGSRFRRMLFPGYGDRQEYVFVCEEPAPELRNPEVEFAAPAAGELLVEATLQYRKVDQTLLNMLLPHGKERAPVTSMSFATARIRIEERS